MKGQVVKTRRNPGKDHFAHSAPPKKGAQKSRETTRKAKKKRTY